MIKNKTTIKPELLAPAGNMEKMKTAFAFGADAVYAGIPDFSLRVRINDFTVKTLKEAVEYAHGINKKVYVTINIFAHNQHLKKLPLYVKKLKEIKPDALIVSDPGVIAYIKELWPEAEIHLSTQANCTNWQAAKFWQVAGVERVILGREVTLSEIKEMKKHLPNLQLETFIHGAMCMAYSGRCFLSKYLVGRSANQGDCVQPCRWEYGVEGKSQTIKPRGHEAEFELVEEQHGSYILNSHDMCLLRRLPELLGAGIDSLKIEGRAKSVYYLGQVIWAYRRGIDAIYDQKLKRQKLKTEIENIAQELEAKLVHRGYTEGFMFEQGKLAQNLVNSHNLCAWEFCGQVVIEVRAKHETYKQVGEKWLNLVKVHNSLKSGDELEIVSPGCDIMKMSVDKLIDPETGELLDSAHGGQGRAVYLEADYQIADFSVLRRRVQQK